MLNSLNFLLATSLVFNPIAEAKYLKLSTEKIEKIPEERLLTLPVLDNISNSEISKPILVSHNLVTPTSQKPKRKVKAVRSRGLNFVQVGIASEYGDYHGRRTASGVRFYRNSDVCAHRTLRFGTRLRVTSLERGGRSTICRVMDRGPFIRGRIVDLSPRSFSQIAPLSQGLVRVRIEVVN